MLYGETHALADQTHAHTHKHIRSGKWPNKTRNNRGH